MLNERCTNLNELSCRIPSAKDLQTELLLSQVPITGRQNSTYHWPRDLYPPDVYLMLPETSTLVRRFDPPLEMKISNPPCSRELLNLHQSIRISNIFITEILT